MPQSGCQTATSPLPLVRCVQTRDIDEQAALLSGWNQTYNQMSAGSFEGAFFEAKVGSVYFFREVTSNFLHQTGELPPGSLAIGVPVALQGSATFCGAACDGQQLHVFSGHSGFEFYSPQGLDIVGVVIDSEALDAAIAMAGCDVLPAIESAHLRSVSAERRLIVQRILLQAQAALFLDGSLANSTERAEALARDLTSAVLDAVINDVSPSPGRLPQTRRWGIAKRACEFANEVPQEFLTIEAMCAHVGVSRRTLQYCFQDALNISPAAYLRAVRLNGARRTIKSGATVTDAATEWGFWHFGRFAQDYRSMFGELPSETARTHHRERN